MVSVHIMVFNWSTLILKTPLAKATKQVLTNLLTTDVSMKAFFLIKFHVVFIPPSTVRDSIVDMVHHYMPGSR